MVGWGCDETVVCAAACVVTGGMQADRSTFRSCVVDAPETAAAVSARRPTPDTAVIAVVHPGYVALRPSC